MYGVMAGRGGERQQKRNQSSSNEAKTSKSGLRARLMSFLQARLNPPTRSPVASRLLNDNSLHAAEGNEIRNAAIKIELENSTNGLNNSDMHINFNKVSFVSKTNDDQQKLHAFKELYDSILYNKTGLNYEIDDMEEENNLKNSISMIINGLYDEIADKIPIYSDSEYMEQLNAVKKKVYHSAATTSRPFKHTVFPGVLANSSDFKTSKSDVMKNEPEFDNDSFDNVTESLKGLENDSMPIYGPLFKSDKGKNESTIDFIQTTLINSDDKNLSRKIVTDDTMSDNSSKTDGYINGDKNNLTKYYVMTTSTDDNFKDLVLRDNITSTVKNESMPTFQIDDIKIKNDHRKNESNEDNMAALINSDTKNMFVFVINDTIPVKNENTYGNLYGINNDLTVNYVKNKTSNKDYNLTDSVPDNINSSFKVVKNEPLRNNARTNENKFDNVVALIFSDSKNVSFEVVKNVPLPESDNYTNEYEIKDNIIRSNLIYNDKEVNKADKSHSDSINATFKVVKTKTLPSHETKKKIVINNDKVLNTFGNLALFNNIYINDSLVSNGINDNLIKNFVISDGSETVSNFTEKSVSNDIDSILITVKNESILSNETSKNLTKMYLKNNDREMENNTSGTAYLNNTNSTFKVVENETVPNYEIQDILIKKFVVNNDGEMVKTAINLALSNSINSNFKVSQNDSVLSYKIDDNLTTKNVMNNDSKVVNNFTEALTNNINSTLKGVQSKTIPYFGINDILIKNNAMHGKEPFLIKVVDEEMIRAENNDYHKRQLKSNMDRINNYLNVEVNIPVEEQLNNEKDIKVNSNINSEKTKFKSEPRNSETQNKNNGKSSNLLLSEELDNIDKFKYLMWRTFNLNNRLLNEDLLRLQEGNNNFRTYDIPEDKFMANIQKLYYADFS